jgi:hypothetical protein
LLALRIAFDRQISGKKRNILALLTTESSLLRGVMESWGPTPQSLDTGVFELFSHQSESGVIGSIVFDAILVLVLNF